MSIYISGLDIPNKKNGAVLIIYPDGKSAFEDGKTYQAVSVPPHGRLIEESKVLDIVSEWCPDDDGSVGKGGDLREMLDEIEALPTIIPADPAEEGK